MNDGFVFIFSLRCISYIEILCSSAKTKFKMAKVISGRNMKYHIVGEKAMTPHQTSFPGITTSKLLF